jgi:calpain-7
MASDNRPKDIKETEGGSRWLTILDSWLPKDDVTEVDALLDELSLNDGGGNQRRRHSVTLSHHYAYLQSGSIDIAWDDACTLFGSVCISWNPVMFKNRLVYHGLVLLALICLRSQLIPAQSLESRPFITSTTR